MTAVDDLLAVGNVVGAMLYRYASEAELQATVFAVLRGAFTASWVKREVALSSRCRIDFLVTMPSASVGVEVKTKGRAAAVRRQLVEYGNLMSGPILLATTKRAHLDIDDIDDDARHLFAVQLLRTA